MKIQINSQAPKEVRYQHNQESTRRLIHYLENIENIEGCFVYWIKDKDGNQYSNLFTTEQISLEGTLTALNHFMNHLKDMKENLLTQIKTRS